MRKFFESSKTRQTGTREENKCQKATRLAGSGTEGAGRKGRRGGGEEEALGGTRAGVGRTLQPENLTDTMVTTWEISGVFNTRQPAHRWDLHVWKRMLLDGRVRVRWRTCEPRAKEWLTGASAGL